MTVFNQHSFRQQFPLICCNDQISLNLDKQNTTDERLIYLDNAATTQKPEQVIHSIEQYYTQLNANVHRSSHQLSAKTTVAYENARFLAQQLIEAKSDKEIVWTSGATESINIITQCLARNTLKPNDEIVIAVSEHHANIVPWQIVAKQTGAVIKVLPLNAQGIIDLSSVESLITLKTKFVACAHISNVIGKINPIEKIITKAKSVGAITVIDGAQYVAHYGVNVQKLDCDFYVFSAHKMFGPTGVGVLYGKKELLEAMSPYQGGGEMIKTVSFQRETTFNELPYKFEAGTPNIAGVIACGESIRFLMPLIKHNNSYIEYEKCLIAYCFEGLHSIKEVNFIVDSIPDVGVISFHIVGHHNQDISSTLNQYGIAIRTGHHCAMPLMEHLNISGCLRVSIAAYNTYEEIDYLIECLKRILSETEVNEAKANSSQINDSLSNNVLSSDNAMTLMIKRFASLKGWDGRHREIMMLGKNFSRLDKSYRTQENLIAGCESLAWLKIDKDTQGFYTFSADSDAKIIRGLLAIVLTAYNNKSAEQIANVDISYFFNELGLMQHLSPSRGNGLLAIVDKIKNEAL